MRADRSYEKGIALQVSLLLPLPKALCSLTSVLAGHAASSPTFLQRGQQLSPALGRRSLISAARSAPDPSGRRGVNARLQQLLWAPKLRGRGL